MEYALQIHLEPLKVSSNNRHIEQKVILFSFFENAVFRKCLYFMSNKVIETHVLYQ